MLVERADSPLALVATALLGAGAHLEELAAGPGRSILAPRHGDERGEGRARRALGQGREEHAAGRGRGQGTGKAVNALGIHGWGPFGRRGRPLVAHTAPAA